MLTADELGEIEGTLLPVLERHHLRLLAHALRTLQQAGGRCTGPVPATRELETWARHQPVLAEDPAFQAQLVSQLTKAAGQLETIAASGGREPLALELADLVAWARRQADARLALPPDPPESAPPR